MPFISSEYISLNSGLFKDRRELTSRRTILTIHLLICAEITFAQVRITNTRTTATIHTSRPVGWLYVLSEHYIHVCKAWVNGRLAGITGSPCSYVGVGGMSVTKRFLFGDEGINVDSFAIASNGSLSMVSSING